MIAFRFKSEALLVFTEFDLVFCALNVIEAIEADSSAAYTDAQSDSVVASPRSGCPTCNRVYNQ
jgi:hypothetical protein